MVRSTPGLGWAGLGWAGLGWGAVATAGAWHENSKNRTPRNPGDTNVPIKPGALQKRYCSHHSLDLEGQECQP